ncbi:sulfotransferase domain-containing protein [Mycolicibacterium sp. XJ2546]
MRFDLAFVVAALRPWRRPTTGSGGLGERISLAAGDRLNIDRRYKNSKNPFLRKGEALAVRSLRNGIRWARPSTFPSCPTVFVNSVPKSGTHLLTQIVEGLESNDDWGTFLNSCPSLTMREVSAESVKREMQKLVPGETARGHVFWHHSLAEFLTKDRIVSYLIYRDPRDVALSEARYLTSMNRYHRMHRVYKGLQPDEALMLSIKGWPGSAYRDVYYPDIGTRYSRYTGWLTHETTLAVRFEDLRSTDAASWIRRIVGHYVNASGHGEAAADQMVLRATRSVNPYRSHTYRQGKSGAWREAYKPEHLEAFHNVAGSLLVELGYESDDSWL